MIQLVYQVRFSSNPKCRSFNVLLGSLKSAETKIQLGVPQGFVLGPLVFNLYTTLLVVIIMKMKHSFLSVIFIWWANLYLKFNKLHWWQ